MMSADSLLTIRRVTMSQSTGTETTSVAGYFTEKSIASFIVPSTEICT